MVPHEEYTPKEVQKIIPLLEKAKLRQYPPRQRLVQVYTDNEALYPGRLPKVVRVKFPWMTFGSLTVCDYVQGLVYIHERKWESLEEAIKLLHRFPFNKEPGCSFGSVCFGAARIFLKHCSVESIFWNTVFTSRHAVEDFWDCHLRKNLQTQNVDYLQMIAWHGSRDECDE